MVDYSYVNVLDLRYKFVKFGVTVVDYSLVDVLGLWFKFIDFWSHRGRLREVVHQP